MQLPTMVLYILCQCLYTSVALTLTLSIKLPIHLGLHDLYCEYCEMKAVVTSEEIS